MKVYVAAVEKDCPAHLALTMEGVEHELLMCDTDTAYGEHLADVWRKGEGFILVEHDIVPFPTAIQALKDCPFHWCSHQYPMNDGTPYGPLDCLGDSLGLVKFGNRVVQRFPSLWQAWEGLHWTVIDGHLEPALRNAHMITVHEHVPPVAHVKVRLH